MDIVRIENILSEYEGKVNGHIAHYYFQMADISVKVNPNAFLSTTVKVDGEDKNIEEVCVAYQTDEYTASIVPNEVKYIIPIIKALKISHPEYKLEESSYSDEEGKVENRYLVCHMADVNDERYEVYVDAINTKYDATVSTIKLLSQNAKLQIGRELSGASLETVKIYDDKLSEIEDASYKSCKGMLDDKLAEVEKGHEEYLEKIADEQKHKQEQAQSREASLKMNMQ